MAQIVAILSRIIFQNELQRSASKNAVGIETTDLSHVKNNY